MLYGYLVDVPVTKPVIGAGEVERDACVPAILAHGGEGFFSIIRGELLAEESTDPGMYPSSLPPSY